MKTLWEQMDGPKLKKEFEKIDEERVEMRSLIEDLKKLHIRAQRILTKFELRVEDRVDRLCKSEIQTGNELTDIRKSSIVFIMTLISRKNIGTKAIQKLIYLLQALGAPLQYRYRMHTYGPYCKELSNDVDLLELDGVVDIENNPSLIILNDSSRAFEEGTPFRTFLLAHGKSYDTLVQSFGARPTHELDMCATAHFTERILRERRGTASDKPAVLREVKIMRPGESDKTIEDAYETVHMIIPQESSNGCESNSTGS